MREKEQEPTAQLTLVAFAYTASGRNQSPQHKAPTATAPAFRFDTLLSAAFAEYAQSGEAYAELHHRYLGVTPPPDSSSCGSVPKLEVGKRTPRLGFIAEEPVHTVDQSGRHIGFEADLAVELVRRINAHFRNARVVLEWVAVDVALLIGPARNRTKLRALTEELRAGKFDIAFSHVVPFSAPDIKYLCPMMTISGIPIIRGCHPPYRFIELSCAPEASIRSCISELWRSKPVPWDPEKAEK